MLTLCRRSLAQPVALRARVDLRTGLLCAGVARPAQGWLGSWPELIEGWAAARDTWRRRFQVQALALALPLGSLPDQVAAAQLDAGLSAAGFAPHVVTLEIDENDIAQFGAHAGLDRLRGRGWGLALRGGDRPQLALDRRARTLFRELVQPRCAPAEDFLGDRETHTMRRIDAARAAGMLVTLERLPAATPPAWLLAAGFDRFERACG
jgi:hypothetical protein